MREFLATLMAVTVCATASAQCTPNVSIGAIQIPLIWENQECTLLVWQPISSPGGSVLTFASPEIPGNCDQRVEVRALLLLDERPCMAGAPLGMPLFINTYEHATSRGVLGYVPPSGLLLLPSFSYVFRWIRPGLGLDPRSPSSYYFNYCADGGSCGPCYPAAPQLAAMIVRVTSG